MKTPLGTEVDLRPGHIVLDGVPYQCCVSLCVREQLSNEMTTDLDIWHSGSS